MRINNNGEQLRIENSIEGLEVIDIFESLEYHNAELKIGNIGMAIKFDNLYYSVNDSHFDSLINCNSILLDKLEKGGV
jgi:hypothetical protein